MVVPVLSSIIGMEPSRCFVAPGIDPPVSSTRRLFPLGFGWQALAGPAAIGDRLVPRHADHRVVVEGRVVAVTSTGEPVATAGRAGAGRRGPWRWSDRGGRTIGTATHVGPVRNACGALTAAVACLRVERRGRDQRRSGSGKDVRRPVRGRRAMFGTAFGGEGRWADRRSCGGDDAPRRPPPDQGSRPAAQRHAPALAALAGGIGDEAVRHRGTIGGSLANNDPAADYPSAVLALGATIKTDRRSIKADDFFETLKQPKKPKLNCRPVQKPTSTYPTSQP